MAPFLRVSKASDCDSSHSCRPAAGLCRGAVSRPRYMPGQPAPLPRESAWSRGDDPREQFLLSTRSVPADSLCQRHVLTCRGSPPVWVRGGPADAVSEATPRAGGGGPRPASPAAGDGPTAGGERERERERDGDRRGRAPVDRRAPRTPLAAARRRRNCVSGSGAPSV